MSQYLSEEKMQSLRGAVRLRLNGDKPENKLLGIQFGRSS
jgi:hypothetical protein